VLYKIELASSRDPVRRNIEVLSDECMKTNVARMWLAGKRGVRLATTS
jgi:hypothetical protein